MKQALLRKSKLSIDAIYLFSCISHILLLEKKGHPIKHIQKSPGLLFYSTRDVTDVNSTMGFRNEILHALLEISSPINYSVLWGKHTKDTSPPGSEHWAVTDCLPLGRNLLGNFHCYTQFVLQLFSKGFFSVFCSISYCPWSETRY